MSWIYHIYQIGNAEVHLPRTAANKKLRDEWTLLTEHIEFQTLIWQKMSLLNSEMKTTETFAYIANRFKHSHIN